MPTSPIRLVVQCILRLWDLQDAVYEYTDVEDEVEAELCGLSFSRANDVCEEGIGALGQYSELGVRQRRIAGRRSYTSH